LGICQYQLGMVESARATFETVLRLDPRNTNTLFNLGYLLIQSGKWERAQELIQRLRPLNQALATKLRQSLAEQRARSEEQRSDAESRENAPAVSVEPEDPERSNGPADGPETPPEPR
jgi:Flp pilus assembly protein TadD